MKSVKKYLKIKARCFKSNSHADSYFLGSRIFFFNLRRLLQMAWIDSNNIQGDETR